MMRHLRFITGEMGMAKRGNKESKDCKENNEQSGVTLSATKGDTAYSWFVPPSLFELWPAGELTMTRGGRCFPRFLELPLFSLAFVIALLPAGVLAQDPCVFVPGGCPPQDIVQAHLIPTLASLFLRLTGGLAIIFIIWANIQILFSWGDEGKIASARQSMLYGALGIGLALLSQLLISFLVTETQNLGTLGPVDLDLTLMASTVRVMLLAFNMIMGVMIFIAGLRMVLAHGKTDDYDKAKTLLTWSIIAAVLTNLSHFVVQIIVTSLT